MFGVLPNKPPLVLVGVDVPACGVEAGCPKRVGVGVGLPKGLPEGGADPNTPEALDADPKSPDGPPEPPVPAPKNPPPWLLDISVTLQIYVCRFEVLVFRKR